MDQGLVSNQGLVLKNYQFLGGESQVGSLKHFEGKFSERKTFNNSTINFL